MIPKNLSKGDLCFLEQYFNNKNISIFEEVLFSTMYNNSKVYCTPLCSNSDTDFNGYYLFHKNFQRKEGAEKGSYWKFSINYTFYYDIIIIGISPLILIKYYLNNIYHLKQKSILLYCAFTINKKVIDFIKENYLFSKIIVIFEAHKFLLKNNLQELIKKESLILKTI
ncbi:MAG: hypothetical protein KGV57_01445 [Fusobacterium sp.]|nr:hypothetical protein [Fusobacterium sp.]